MHPKTDNDLTRKVERVMENHKGYDNRISRERLARICRTSDRKLRDALSQLPVVHDDGYFVPTSEREAEPYRAAMRSRQAAIGQRLRVLDEYLRQHQEPVRYEQKELINYR